VAQASHPELISRRSYDSLSWFSVSVDFADDGFGGPGPGEGTRIVVGLGDVAVDRRLEVHDRADVTSPELPSRQGREERRAEKNVSTALIQEDEVGVKWNTQRGCRESHARTLGCLWAP
jgi:hypothetical protein